MPPAVVTVTSTVPAACAGEVTVRDVEELTLTPVPGLPPKLTVVAPTTKPVPMTVTVVAPARGPVVGATDVTVGTAA